MVAMRKAKLIINQDPTAKGRPRFAKAGFAYTDAKTRAAEVALKYEMKSKFQEKPFDVPIKVKMFFGMPRPKTVKRKYPAVKPDADNLAKSVCDAGNGTLWVDDYLIVTLHIEKRYSDEGFIEIHIEEICD